MPASPEVYRALGVLCERPQPEHGRLARALGLPPPPDAATFTEAFVFQLVPYAAPYLSPDGMLGGEAADRVAGFWRALRRTPPAEPDHLAALLGLYAELCERESAERGPGQAAGWREARRALLWEHLLTWVPLYADAMAQLPSPFHSAWARLLREMLLQDAAELAPSPSIPLHLREVPELPDPWRAEFARALLAPARSGLLITRSDLAEASAATGLASRAGARAFMLGALIDQDRAATFDWLSRHGAWWAGRHEASIPSLGYIAQHWLGRVRASLRLLEQSPQHS